MPAASISPGQVVRDQDRQLVRVAGRSDERADGHGLSPSLSANADIHASAEFQLIAISLVEYEPMSSV
jgi:hypothetical protein